MRVRTPDYYKEFKCIDKKCTDSCCAGWEVDLDDASVEYYRSVKGDFGERLKAVMVFEEGENRFRLCENGRCPFLNDENLCDLYIALGEDKLCKTCAEHPRYMADFGDLREMGISLSCPEAARIILSKKNPVAYDMAETDEPNPLYSDLDPQKYMMLVMERKEAYAAAADRSRSIEARMRDILVQAGVLQKKLTRRNVNKTAKSVVQSRRELMYQWLLHIKNYECVNPAWNDMLQTTLDFLKCTDDEYRTAHEQFEQYHAAKAYEYEQLVMYFLYRYFVSSVYDYDLLSKLKLTAFALLVCKEFATALYQEKHKFTFKDQIEVVHCFSRQFEHSDENVEAINKSFRTEELFDISQFIEIL
jgi:lysine-N-methylase